MQDKSNGKKRDLTPFLENIPVITPADAARMLRDRAEEIQRVKDTVQPDRTVKAAIQDLLQVCGSDLSWMEQVSRVKISRDTRAISPGPAERMPSDRDSAGEQCGRPGDSEL